MSCLVCFYLEMVGIPDALSSLFVARDGTYYQMYCQVCFLLEMVGTPDALSSLFVARDGRYTRCIV